MSDEDLGSFFEEINQIEAAAVVEEPSEKLSSSCVIAGPVVAGEAVSYAPKVISKAPEIVYKSSHPVYTYDQAGLSDIHAPVENDGGYAAYTGYNVASSSSNNYQQSSSSNMYQGGLAIAPTMTYSHPVPPPQVPRQDKVFVRKAADSTWVDESLQEWPENDYRIFVGDLAKEVNTEHLAKMFQQYKSFAKAKVSRLR